LEIFAEIRFGKMKFEPTDLILRRRVAPSRMDGGTISLVAALRDARKSALLRTRLMDDIDMIQTSEILHEGSSGLSRG
jgi:hypothetical protein